MRPKALLLLQTLTLLAALCLLPGTDGPAFATTTVTKTGKCAVTVRIDIEVYGPWVASGDVPSADDFKNAQATAKKWERQIENAWNGPTADVAKAVAEKNGLDPLPFDIKTREKWDKMLKAREQVDKLARQKLKDAGVQEGCAWVNCCRICFDVNIIVNRNEFRPAFPARHKIDLAPPGTSTGHVGSIGGLGDTDAGTHSPQYGKWSDNPDVPIPPHESGHLMGLPDQYTNEVIKDPATGRPVTDPQTGRPKKKSVPKRGHKYDIMANNFGWPTKEAITTILKIGGVDCNCCKKKKKKKKRPTTGTTVPERPRTGEEVPGSDWVPEDWTDEPISDEVVIGEYIVYYENSEWCNYWGWEVPIPITSTPPPTTPEEEPPPEGTPTTTTTPEEVPTPEEEPPPSIVKAKVTDSSTGEAVTGCQLKFASVSPELPLPGAPKGDAGYNEGPIQATTGPDGTAILASGKAATEFRDGGEPAVEEAVELDVELPAFKSYIAKITLDRGKANWYDPASYLGPRMSASVVRKWIVGDSMYVVINIPEVEGK